MTLMVFNPFTSANSNPSVMERAVQDPAGPVKRADDPLYRGWALAIYGDCPAKTFRCGLHSCCPEGSGCGTEQNTESNICCPGTAGCGFQVALDNRCADTSWTLWETNNDPICCLPGQKGTQPIDTTSYGSCVPATKSVAKASLATKVCISCNPLSGLVFIESMSD